MLLEVVVVLLHTNIRGYQTHLFAFICVPATRTLVQLSADIWKDIVLNVHACYYYLGRELTITDMPIYRYLSQTAIL